MFTSNDPSTKKMGDRRKADHSQEIHSRGISNVFAKTRLRNAGYQSWAKLASLRNTGTELQKKASLTECPWCAGSISMGVYKCRHCASDIQWVSINDPIPCRPQDRDLVEQEQQTLLAKQREKARIERERAKSKAERESRERRRREKERRDRDRETAKKRQQLEKARQQRLREGHEKEWREQARREKELQDRQEREIEHLKQLLATGKAIKCKTCQELVEKRYLSNQCKKCSGQKNKPLQEFLEAFVITLLAIFGLFLVSGLFGKIVSYLFV